MSTSSKPHLTTEEIQKTRAKFRQFRILVIGRANAGKTTILRKVCNTTDDAIIFDPEGNKVNYMMNWFKRSCPILIFLPVISGQVVHPRSILESKQSPRSCIDDGYNNLMPQRGEHDIENQMVFEGNPGFVFHDSRGFEIGGERELKVVQRFIEQRSKADNVEEQLHAIWCVGATCIYRTNQFLTVLFRYCISTTDDRPITAAEKKFFNKCGTGLGRHHLINMLS